MTLDHGINMPSRIWFLQVECFSRSNNPKAFIITPRQRVDPPEVALPGIFMFTGRVQQIANELRGLMPEAPLPTVLEYAPRGPDRIYELLGVFSDTYGKVLFEYNPIGALVPDPKGSPGTQHTPARLSVEHNRCMKGAGKFIQINFVRKEGNQKQYYDGDSLAGPLPSYCYGRSRGLVELYHAFYMYRQKLELRYLILYGSVTSR